MHDDIGQSSVSTAGSSTARQDNTEAAQTKDTASAPTRTVSCEGCGREFRDKYILKNHKAIPGRCQREQSRRRDLTAHKKQLRTATYRRKYERKCRENPDTYCTICYSYAAPTQATVSTRCRHKFHLECIEQHKRQTTTTNIDAVCPHCHKYITSQRPKTKSRCCAGCGVDTHFWIDGGCPHAFHEECLVRAIHQDNNTKRSLEYRLQHPHCPECKKKLTIQNLTH